MALYTEDSAGSGSHDLVVGIERLELAIPEINSPAWFDFTASSEELTADEVKNRLYAFKELTQFEIEIK